MITLKEALINKDSVRNLKSQRKYIYYVIWPTLQEMDFLNKSENFKFKMKDKAQRILYILMERQLKELLKSRKNKKNLVFSNKLEVYGCKIQIGEIWSNLQKIDFIEEYGNRENPYFDKLNDKELKNLE